MHRETEDVPAIINNIDNGVVFRGTNLWVLIFAIFVASLGLNVNSTAVIIGAMLISPLMGPIMGIGLGIGINDLKLLHKSFYNYMVATIVALTTSTIFFSVSPLNDAHSEILARTSPTVYDVLIAFFGGFAGIIATSSRQKGNVIPGVAIATALMPPLCTAGYGLATLQLNYFIGAFYLFIINTVFIALATFIIVRLLNFPYKEMHNEKSEKMAHRVVWTVAIITLLPSLYFGYDLVQQDRFTKKANRFIANEAHFPNDYLLNKKVEAKERKIILVFGGQEITKSDIEHLRAQLIKYNLENTLLDVKQGFAYMDEDKSSNNGQQLNQLNFLLTERQKIQDSLQQVIDSLRSRALSIQLFKEIKAQYPSLKNVIVQPTFLTGDSASSKPALLVMMFNSPAIPAKEKIKLERWLTARLQNETLKTVFEQ